MRALTICQPYAHLILIGEKRTENRTWPTSYRGPLLLHAGKSHKWLAPGDLDRYPDLPFGALVGQCQLVDCVRPHDRDALRRFPWLRNHPYAEGPWCWILEEAQTFATPIPLRGKQGLFMVSNRSGVDVTSLPE